MVSCRGLVRVAAALAFFAFNGIVAEAHNVTSKSEFLDAIADGEAHLVLTEHLGESITLADTVMLGTSATDAASQLQDVQLARSHVIRIDGAMHGIPRLPARQDARRDAADVAFSR